MCDRELIQNNGETMQPGSFNWITLSSIIYLIKMFAKLFIK